jgi:LCP family protein required for cell wall assembly
LPEAKPHGIIVRTDNVRLSLASMRKLLLLGQSGRSHRPGNHRRNGIRKRWWFQLRSRRDRRNGVQRDEYRDNLHDELGEIEETRVFRREQVEKPRRRGSWFRVVGAVLGAVLLFGGGAVLGFVKFASNPPSGLIPPDDQAEFQGRINILVLGIDTGVNGGSKSLSPEGKRSDVIMVVSVDPELEEVGILSVPRDTRAFIPKDNSSYEKIGHAHAYGGPDLAVKAVEMLLKVPIHHYVRVDFEGFKRVVDRLGGIDIDVPENMYYKDPYQDLIINIPKGPRHLDGEAALSFVRYRQYTTGDIGRIQAQELFIKALIKKAVSLQNAFKIPDLIGEMLPYFYTSLSTEDLLYLGTVAVKIQPEDVHMGLVPGTFEDRVEGQSLVSYWTHDVAGTEKIVSELIDGVDPQRNSEIRVAVENGCGITGAADKLATILRDEGFQVVSVGNAKRQDYTTTTVKATGEQQRGQVLVLRSVKSICSQVEAIKAKDKDIPEDADVLVIIGRDFQMPI